MTPYRTAVARPPIEPAPSFPTPEALTTRARRAFAILVAIGGGVIGWLIVAPIAADLDRPFLDEVPWVPPTYPEMLVRALPALLSTTLTSGGVAWLAFPRARWTPLVALAGAIANGFLYGFLTVGLLGFPFGIVAAFVGVPLGVVFGLVYTPFVWAAGNTAEPASVTTPARAKAVGAAFLFVAALAALALTWQSDDIEDHGWSVCIPSALIVLAVVTLAASSLERTRAHDLSFALALGTHPSLALLPPELALPSDTAPRIHGEGLSEVQAVVAREELELPLHGRPRTLALLEAS